MSTTVTLVSEIGQRKDWPSGASRRPLSPLSQNLCICRWHTWTLRNRAFLWVLVTQPLSVRYSTHRAPWPPTGGPDPLSDQLQTQAWAGGLWASLASLQMWAVTQDTNKTTTKILPDIKLGPHHDLKLYWEMQSTDHSLKCSWLWYCTLS